MALNGGKGRGMRPVLLQTVPLLLVVSWLQGGSKKINKNPAGLSKTFHTNNASIVI